jgi:salicylate hydroxylase
MKIAIVGGGIGGLTAALALRQAGLEAHVYEQAGVLREVGAGLTMGPNAVNILHQLGLAEALGAVGVVPQSRDLRDWQSGAILARVPLAEAAQARWGAPFYSVHRADLHDALRAALGDRHVTLGALCVSVEQHASEVAIRFGDGRTASADLLIGADGIHSVVREYVVGPDRPSWSGQIAWRGLAPGAVGHEVGLELRHQLFLGPRRMFIAYYVASGRLINWVGVSQNDDEWTAESWSARGDRDEALTLYAGWHPQVRAIIGATESIYKWALFDRPPLEMWTRGRVLLLGDAAHPMLPFMGQGAAQSIEDALVLARCLAAGRDEPEHAIGLYADRRRRRTAALQAASRDAGRTMQLSDPDEVAVRNARMLERPRSQIDASDWVWGYDVERAMSDEAGPAYGLPEPVRA